MKILIYGGWKDNNGPSNVVKSLILNSDEDLMYIKSSNKIIKGFEIFFKLIRSDIVVTSGIVSFRFQNILKKMNKKFVILMHGCNEYENKINNLNLDSNILKREKFCMENSSLIIAVSEVYSFWLKNRFPEYAHKITFVNNGVEINRRISVSKNKNTIALSGGNRNIKNNYEVCLAVQRLIQKGIDCTVNVYGYIYPENKNLNIFPFVNIKNQMNKNDFYDELDKTELFVLNSELEPFGLVIADALNCNCSLLVSKNVGSSSILKLEENDIINNPHDIDEIEQKVYINLKQSNSERLYNSLDLKRITPKSSYVRLKSICCSVIEGNYKDEENFEKI